MKFVKNEKFGCEVSKREHLIRFAKSQGLPEPILVPIRRKGLSGSGDHNQCHTNSLLMADRYGGRVLTGLSLSILGPNSACVVGHSVWVSPEGHAVCLTGNSGATFPNPDDCTDFIPLWVYDEDECREFFEENKVLRVPADYVLTSDMSHIEVEGTTQGDLVVRFLSDASRNQRKSFLKTNKKWVGSGRGSLRRYLTSNRNSKIVHYQWFLETQKKNFLRGKSPRLAEVA
jgi:hypothetical protein